MPLRVFMPNVISKRRSAAVKNILRIISVILLLALLAGMCACGGEIVSGCRVVSVVGSRDYQIAFRYGDPLRDTVTAAIQVLAAYGTLRELSESWLGSDLTTVSADADALNYLGEIAPRLLIVGVAESNEPMTCADGDSYTGFDAELAKKVCQLLGWELRFQPISVENVNIELASGNIDCAWSGMSFDPDSEPYDLSPVYITSEIWVVVRNDSEIKRLRQLKEKTLAIWPDAASKAIVNDADGFAARLSAVKEMTSVSSCFIALEKGAVDAIMVDSISARQYM